MSVYVVRMWWKCQCVSVSVEVSVFKGFSGRTLRNAFGNNLTYRSVPSRMPCRHPFFPARNDGVMQAAPNGVVALALCVQWLLLLLFIGGSQQRTEVQEQSRCVADSPHPFFTKPFCETFFQNVSGRHDPTRHDPTRHESASYIAGTIL